MPKHSAFEAGRSVTRRSPPGRPGDQTSPFRQPRRIEGTLTLTKAPLRQPEPNEGDRR